MTANPHPRGYNAVPAQVDLPAMEHEILKLWEAQGTFDASLAKTAGGPAWTFYEGPPTANGMPRLWKYGRLVKRRHSVAPAIVRPEPKITCAVPWNMS